MQTINETPIVLTATIAPNEVYGVVSDPEVRKKEYVRAVQFYSRFTRQLFFLENSNYSLTGSPMFEDLPNVQVVNLPVSSDPRRGKGYQEFEMIDAWAASGLNSHRWLKISGRYIIRNVGEVLDECSQEIESSLIIDQSVRSQTARTQIFFVTTAYYRSVIMNLYRQCDDKSGQWIEKVLFQKLKKTTSQNFRFFRTRPQVIARSGTTGKTYPTSRVGNALKDLLRASNRLIDDRYLWFSR